MADSREDRLAQIAQLVHSTAESSSNVTPKRSRVQKERLRVAVSSHYVALDELNHVFQDINSTSALDYFDPDDAVLIRRVASSLSDARRALRHLASREWLRKQKP